MGACRSGSSVAEVRRGFTFLAILSWIGGVLLVDSAASGVAVHLLGVLTWLLLIALVAVEPAERRAGVALQVGIVVVFATVIEYVFSQWLGAYRYLDGHVPAYVPPGHGLVYLAALTFAQAAWVRERPRLWIALTVAAGALLAGYGLLVVRPADWLGAFWYLCLLGFLRWGPTRLLYVGAFVVVTALEWAGTWLDVWTWAPYDPVLGVIGQGNPPSVAAGGYGWFDLAAVALTPWLARWLGVRTGLGRGLTGVGGAGVTNRGAGGAGVGEGGEGGEQAPQRAHPVGVGLRQRAVIVEMPAAARAAGGEGCQIREAPDEVLGSHMGEPE